MEIISGNFWNCEKNGISVKKRWKSAKKNQKVSGPGLYKRILLVQKQPNKRQVSKSVLLNFLVDSLLLFGRVANMAKCNQMMPSTKVFCWWREILLEVIARSQNTLCIFSYLFIQFQAGSDYFYSEVPSPKTPNVRRHFRLRSDITIQMNSSNSLICSETRSKGRSICSKSECNLKEKRHTLVWPQAFANGLATPCNYCSTI